MANISVRLGQLRDWLRLLSLLLNPSRASAAKLYGLLSTKNVLSDQLLFLNLGYWGHAQSYDEACYALARVLAQAAEMREDDIVLDAGFGFAEQDLYWVREFRPRSIIGLNIARAQVEVAAQRVRGKDLSDRIFLVHGSATEMPIVDQSVTKVVALESAFHFNVREQFFEEAARVLKPGGRIATADVLYFPRAVDTSVRRRALDQFGRAIWQMPKSNLDSIESYAEKLRRAGFVEVQVHSIRDQVLVPFRSYLRNWLGTPHLASRMDPFVKVLWRVAISEMKPGGALDYVLATARRA